MLDQNDTLSWKYLVISGGIGAAALVFWFSSDSLPILILGVSFLAAPMAKAIAVRGKYAKQIHSVIITLQLAVPGFALIWLGRQDTAFVELTMGVALSASALIVLLGIWTSLNSTLIMTVLFLAASIWFALSGLYLYAIIGIVFTVLTGRNLKKQKYSRESIN